jgi:hypothetical protein
MIHILGFDSNLYSTYLNPTTGGYYSSVVSAVTTNYASRPTTSMIVTPYVIVEAQAYFGCSSLAGMQLEN